MPRAMSVVHVVRQFHPSIGGLEDAVAGLVREQREAGVDARVVTLNRVFTDPDCILASQDCIDGVPVTRLGWRGSSRYPLAPSVLGAISGADLVHVHAVDFFFDFLAATRPLHRKTLVATTHGGFFHTGRNARLKRVWFETVTRLSVGAYDAIIACSDNDAATFARLAGDRLVTIENGVNVDKFSHPPMSRASRRMIYVGRLASHKRIECLFAMLAALRRRVPREDWELVIAGGGGDVPPEELRARAEAGGVARHVRFVLSPSTAELAAELAQAAIYVCASSYEGFGLAAVEAAASGLVPALSDIPPFARLVRRLGAGAVFDPDDPEGAADVIARLPSDAQTRARVAEAARSYGWSKPARACLNVYSDVLARRELRPMPA